MRFEKKYKPELISSKDISRESIQHTELDAKGNRLIATDGHKLVVIPCTSTQTDVSGAIPDESLSISRKAQKGLPEITLTCLSETITEECTGTTLKRPKRNYPPIDQVIPDYSKCKTKAVTCFSAKYLDQIAKALGEDVLELEFDYSDRLSPIKIRVKNTEAFAVLMPCKGL